MGDSFGKAIVTPVQGRYLAGLRTKLAGARLVTCVGHTDDRGNKAASLKLGERRALQVCRELTARLNIRTNVAIRGEAAAGMARNRRVDITIHY